MAKASTPSALAAWYVISLRPSGEHSRVRRLAQQLGARVFALSTVRIASLSAGSALAEALACDTVIVTSPAAVRAAIAHAPLRPRYDQAWLAIGSGTARALRRAGIATVVTPQRPDSDSLLALPLLQAASGRDIGLLTAPGGRDLIAPTLQARGARVRRADVYRRQPVPVAPQRVQQMLALPSTTALLVSSSEAFDGLWQALPTEQRERLHQRVAIASSARLAAHLAARGFTRIVTAEGAAPTQLLAALARHVGGGSLPVG